MFSSSNCLHSSRVSWKSPTISYNDAGSHLIWLELRTPWLRRDSWAFLMTLTRMSRFWARCWISVPNWAYWTPAVHAILATDDASVQSRRQVVRAVSDRYLVVGVRVRLATADPRCGGGERATERCTTPDDRFDSGPNRQMQGGGGWLTRSKLLGPACIVDFPRHLRDVDDVPRLDRHMWSCVAGEGDLVVWGAWCAKCDLGVG